jgi:uncharacterized protein
MNIRSITYFINPGWPIDRQALELASRFIQAARLRFSEAGYTVQTVRLATVPYATLGSPADWPRLAGDLETAAVSGGFDYLALGPALPGIPASYPVIPEILADHPSVFFSGLLTLPEAPALSLEATRACAEVIFRCATLSPDGFGNLRFAALANVPPGSPFFPAAYHAGSQPGFALAIEAADLGVSAFTNAATIAEARLRLKQAVETEAQRLEALAASLSAEWKAGFIGLDFTMAPFPEESRSLGTALERLGVPAVGMAGSLAASAILAEGLDRTHYKRTGFNGLMFPVLEDATLAARAAEGLLHVNDLLLYSAVCGTGLDTIPLPGDTSPAQLGAILLDVAALALRLNKPLTARLMPIPGKSVGDPTDFDFAYFANSRIIALPGAPLKGPLAGSEIIDLFPRHT